MPLGHPNHQDETTIRNDATVSSSNTTFICAKKYRSGCRGPHRPPRRLSKTTSDRL